MLSVIIPTCNRNNLLTECLSALHPNSQTLEASEYEIIVTDDSTQQQAKQLIDNNFTWVKWVAGPLKGPAANRNNGANNASGDWLVFIDDDCIPNAELLRMYQKAISEKEKVLVFEGCIKTERERQSLAEESPVNETGGYLWSCNFMIEKKLFLNTLNGFDENFPFAAMEDVDLDYRLSKKGFKKVFLQNAFVIHPWRLQKKMWDITLKRFESTLYFLKKHPEKKSEINSRYYLIAFYNSLFKNTFKNAVKYKFKGISDKLLYDMLQLYFSCYLLFKKV